MRNSSGASVFTPGPWWIDRHGSACPLAIRAQLDGDVDSDTGQHIVVGGELIAAMPDGDEANASLIVAAPELYEAGTAILKTLEGQTLGISAEAMNAFAIALSGLHAALAKARGETPNTGGSHG